MNKRLKAIIIGTMLGDGNLEKPQTNNANSRLTINHCKKQYPYIKWLFKELRNLNPAIGKYITGKGAYNCGKIMYRIQTKCFPELKIYYGKIYKPKKIISKEWLKGMTSLSLAVWYMDDGYRNTLNTQCFTKKDLEILCDFLKQRFSIIAEIRKYPKFGKLYYILVFTGNNLRRFYKLIKPHLLSSMKYKLQKLCPIKHKKCKYCDKKFEIYRNHQIICGNKKCKRIAEQKLGKIRRLKKHNSRTFKCVICDKPFHPRTSKCKTCSEKCGDKRELETQKIRRHKPMYGKIESIEIINSKNKYVYDIEVKDNHTYIANNFIVSNSQSISPYKVSQSILPMGGAVQGGAKIIQCGVPGVRGTHFHKAFRNIYDPETNPFGYRQHLYPWDKCPILDRDYVLARKADDPISFAAQYELSWEKSNIGMFLSDEEWEKCCFHYDFDDTEGKPLRGEFLGIDVARLRDSTVITEVRQDPDNPEHLYVVGWWELQGTDFTEQIGFIKNLFHPRMKAIYIDSSPIGLAPLDILAQAGLPVVGISFDIQHKDKIYKHLQNLIQQGKIHWPKFPPPKFAKEYLRFKQQMMELEKEYKLSGLMSCHANLDDRSAKDDYGDSLALATYAASQFVESSVYMV